MHTRQQAAVATSTEKEEAATARIFAKERVTARERERERETRLVFAAPVFMLAPWLARVFGQGASCLLIDPC